MRIGRPWNSDPTELSLRPFDGSPGDFEALAQIRNLTLRPVSLPEDFSEWSGEEAGRFYNRGGYSLLSNCWLIFHSGEGVAATAVYPRSLFPERPPSNFDMYVVPEYRRHGLGSRLLAHLERAAEARGYPVLETTIPGEDVPSTTFLVGHGFATVGQSLHLSLYDLSGARIPDLPEGFALRSLAELERPLEYYMEMANRLGSYDSNCSLITPETIAGLVGSDRWDPDGVIFLLDSAGRAVGVIRASGARSGRGYLHEVRLEPSVRGIGLGRALLGAALTYLRQAGAGLAELDTPGEHTAAHALALGAGFTVTRHWLHFLKRV